MSSAEVFKNLVDRAFAPTLRALGFSRQHLSFCVRLNGNYGVISFQKSRTSNAALTLFTVNLGVVSTTLLDFFSDGPRGGRFRKLDDCQLRERLGFLLPDRQDTWWEVNPGAYDEGLAREISDSLREVAVPYLLTFGKDEALRDLWLSGVSPGLTEHGRLKNLLVLLHALGPAELIGEITQDLLKVSEREPSQYGVRRFFEKLDWARNENTFGKIAARSLENRSQ
jgi:hypothetical protein